MVFKLSTYMLLLLLPNRCRRRRLFNWPLHRNLKLITSYFALPEIVLTFQLYFFLLDVNQRSKQGWIIPEIKPKLPVSA